MRLDQESELVPGHVQLPRVLQQSSQQGILLVSFFHRRYLLKEFDNHRKLFLKWKDWFAEQNLELRGRRTPPDTGTTGCPARGQRVPGTPTSSLDLESFQTSAVKHSQLQYEGIEARLSSSFC